MKLTSLKYIFNISYKWLSIYLVYLINIKRGIEAVWESLPPLLSIVMMRRIIQRKINGRDMEGFQVPGFCTCKWLAPSKLGFKLPCMIVRTFFFVVNNGSTYFTTKQPVWLHFISTQLAQQTFYLHAILNLSCQVRK